MWGQNKVNGINGSQVKAIYSMIVNNRNVHKHIFKGRAAAL